MNKRILKKSLVIAIIMLLVVGIGIIPAGTIGIKQSTVANLDGDTLYVGGNGTGNYTKIQDAINDASDGDTVFVYDDSSPYCEKLEVYVSINLIGEDRDTTIIDGGGSRYVVRVSTDYVNISGFTIRSSEGNYAGIDIISDYNTITDNIISNNNYCGIYIYDSKDNTITGNNISNNYYGIIDRGSSNNNITGNIISNNEDGILMDNSKDNTITGNNISNNNYYGILYIYDSKDNTITGNNITFNGCGIYICSNTSNNIIGNIISNNDHGIEIYGSSNNITGNNITFNGCGICIYGSSTSNNITGNIISNNDYGICIYSSNNVILKNNFLNNKRHAFFKNCNTWKQNYWDRPRILPKLIFGTIKIGSIWIPWINIDWRPAKEPYDIGV